MLILLAWIWYLNSGCSHCCWRNPPWLMSTTSYLWPYWDMWGQCIESVCCAILPLGHPLVIFYCLGVHAVAQMVHLLSLWNERQIQTIYVCSSWWSQLCPSHQLTFVTLLLENWCFVMVKLSIFLCTIKSTLSIKFL